jgi:membrane fusion protein (multidrug efflux system)
VSLLCLCASLAAWGCDDSEGASDESTPAPVVVERVRAETFRRRARGIGSLETAESVDVSAEVPGLIDEVHVRGGQAVEAGDPLFTLNDERLGRELTAAEARVEAGEARVRETRRTYERYDRLIEEGVVTEEQLEAARAAYRTAQADTRRGRAQVRLVRERLDDTRIRAPLDGRLAQRLVDAGDYVKVGAVLVRLYTPRRLEAEFSVPGRYAGHIRRGQPVEVHVASLDDALIRAKVDYVAPRIDPATRSLTIESRIEDANTPAGRLQAGMFLSAAVIIETRADRPAVAERALVARRQGYALFILDANTNTVRLREVTTGLRRAGLVELAKGAGVGESVVVSGQMRLSDGDEVLVERAESAPSGAGADATGLEGEANRAGGSR